MMGSLFIIEADADTFDCLAVKSGHEQLRLLDGTRRSESWTPVPVKTYPATNPAMRGKPVDFPGLPGGLAFSVHALEVIYPLIGEHIEALPLAARRGKFYAVNVLDKVDLDEAASEFRRVPSGRIASVTRYAFRPGSTDGKHIFKLGQKPLGEVIVSAEFKELVEARGLVGLLFKEIDAAPERR